MPRRRRWKYLPVELRREIMRLAAKGTRTTEIVEKVDVSQFAVLRAIRPLGGMVRPDMLAATPSRLSLEDRVEIRIGLEQHESLGATARRLGRSVSTISREVKRNGGQSDYRPVTAHRAAIERARRPKPTKLGRNPRLCARVSSDLGRLHSPQQIAAKLAIEFGDDMSMRVSHETIYKSLYVQGRGELRRELARCLRTGRAVRKPQGRLETRGKIPGMIMISDRPAEVADRAVPGHWEGDLIIGKNGNSAIGTLVERTTRFVMLLHLPDDRKADTVRQAMTEQITSLPDQLRRSITWDQGHEMMGHAKFSIETGVPVYFCDPHSPWQRGSNENTNGLLRQYFPKGTDLSVHTAADLDTAAASLNSRPRQTLGWMTPSQKLAELVATTV
jgi:IS30 family transposase